MTSYAVTEVTTKDGTRYRAGEVVKFDNLQAFGDCLILGFSEPDKYGDVYVKLARPHASATCVGTTGPGVALQVEEIEMTLPKLVQCGPPVNDGWPRVLGLKAPAEVEKAA